MESVFTPDQLFAPDVVADPYPAIANIRDRSPFNCVMLPAGLVPGIEEEMRSWALLKYDDVYGVLRSALA